MEPLEYSRLYSYQDAADAIGVSLAWAERWIGNAIKSGMVTNLGSEDKPRVNGGDLKKICMARWAQLETEHRWRAFEQVRARERGEVEEEIL